MTISIVIPVHNGASTIVDVLKSLQAQGVLYQKIVIIDDGSTDPSCKIITQFLKKDRIKNCLFIKHKNAIGLAASYNEGIKSCDSDLIITMHQDILLMDDAMKKLLLPFNKDNQRIVAASHVVYHPLSVWNKYNFWQKTFFSRLVQKKFSGIDGKFDCFKKEALYSVGLFDQKQFRTAGEDGDIVFKLKKIGEIAETKAEIIHIHRNDGAFGLRDLVKKQAQYSEAQGALLRNGRVNGIKQLLKMFFREIMLVLLLIPYLNIFAVIAIVLYSYFYTSQVYIREWRDTRVITLPFVNIFLLFVSLIFSSRGLIRGQQGL